MHAIDQVPKPLWRQWPVYVVWLALAVQLSLPAWPNPLIAAPFGQDDALRLVQVRDLLAGQAWYDLVQHRLQPPQGLDMHWSRLIDAPMVVLAWLFGEQAMLFLWPSLLIGAFLFAALYAVRQLSTGIDLLPVLLVSALCLVPLSYFAPARIDHHNVQMVLALVLAGAIMRPLQTKTPAVISALCCALMMAIGLETLPYVVVALAVISASWALGLSNDKPVALFATSFAGLTAFVWVAQTNFQSQAAVCDMLSPAYLIPIIFGCLGLVISTQLCKNLGRKSRFGMLVLTAIMAVAVFVWTNPVCLGGPMAEVPGDLQERWLKTVAEAQPVWSIVQSAPNLAVERYGPPLLALAAALVLFLKRPQLRYGLTVILALLLAAMVISVVQLRGTLFAHVFTIPVFALAIDLARKNFVANQKSVKAVVILAMAFLTCQSLFFMIASPFAAPSQIETSAVQPISIAAMPLTKIESECAGQNVRDAVAMLGKANIAAPVFLGAQILEMGSASVIAGPYHRATVAIFDMLKLFEDGPVAERNVLSRRSLDYLVVCLTSDDTADVVSKHPQSLTARLKNGDVPNWLQPLPKAGQLAIYRVLPNQ